MKEILKNTAISIGISMTIFCIVGVIFDVTYGGNFQMEHYQFTKMVAACLVTGLGYGVPTVVYRKENLPRSMQFIIHMSIGCIVYTIAAFLTGWIPVTLGIGKCVLIVIGQLSVAVIIGFLFKYYYRKEAQMLNQRIQEMK